MAWDHHYVTYGTQCDIMSGEDTFDTCMVVIKVPVPVAILSWFADRICNLTGHYYCASLPMRFIRALEMNHSEEFPISVEDEVAIRYAQWRKWPPPFWAVDEEDDELENHNE